jgi:hypothetical protein
MIMKKLMQNTDANQSRRLDISKRSLLALLGTLPIFSACGSVKGQAEKVETNDPLRYKFRGLYGGVLRLDAVTPKGGVTITSETGRTIDAPGSLSLKNVFHLTYTSGSVPVPKSIRATWREGNFTSMGNALWNGGTIIGDYTVPVAERIPDDFLDFIRANGGALRLKIRLVDDGILIGWDIEQRIPIRSSDPKAGNYLNYALPGGDFCEAQFNKDTRQLDPGWYIDKSGKKVFTDY